MKEKILILAFILISLAISISNIYGATIDSNKLLTNSVTINSIDNMTQYDTTKQTIDNNADIITKKIDSNILIGIISIIVAILISIIPWIKKKFFIRPELTIELIPYGGLNSNEGLSWKNDLSEGYIEGEKAIHVWGLKWKFKIIIRNNSDVTAFYPKIYHIKSGIWFTWIDSLNNLKPIKNTDDNIELNCEYQKYTESIPSKRPKIGKYPIEFQDLKMLLEYKNSAKIKFYTLFDFGNYMNNNKFYKSKPKGFE